MAEVARVDDSLNSLSTGNSQYCSQRYSYSCNCDEDGCSTCYDYYYSSATVTGKVNSGSNNVFTNGKAVAFNGSQVNTSASCPSGYSGSSSGNGAVTNGSSTVFVNGKALSVKGSRYRAHTSSSDTSTIASGSNNVYAGG